MGVITLTATALALGRAGASAGLPSWHQAHHSKAASHGQLGFLTGHRGFFRMGLRVGWGLETEPEVAASSCFSGVWGLLSHLAPGPLELTSSCLGPSWRGVSKCTAGNPGLQMGRVAVITLAWQDSPGHLALAGSQACVRSLPMAPRADWCWARGSDLQPLALPPLPQVLGHRGQLGGALERD